ncbi:T9SS type A sorting domain-containing protein [Pontibacter liquoris]|uniref:T9SS type A sorting domain-containing protein n=1 Tax=Pontibacter liquoris TaxID=2905677 RepID=UPI001FA6D857|nr:T9SS type A sorting domain-containing protein [Pontibacter liquoris]
MAGTFQHMITGTATTEAGAILTSTAATGTQGLAVTGLFTNAGTLNAGAGTHTFTSLTNSSTGTLNASSSTIQVGNTFTNNGTFTPGTGMVTYTGANQTITPVPYYNLTLAGTGTKTANTNLAIGNNLLVNTGVTFAAGGTANLTHTVAGSVTNNGVFNPATATVYNQLQVTGSLTNAGTFHALAGNNTVTGNLTNTGTLNAGTGTHIISGNWSNTGTFNAGSSLISLNGTSKTITSTGTGNFNNLSVSNGASALNSDITVDGNLRVDNTNLTTGASTLHLGSKAEYLSEETALQHITGNLQTTRNLVMGNGEVFGQIGLRILGSKITAPAVTLKRVTGTVVTGLNGNQSVLRQYYITTAAATPLSTPIEMKFPDYELNGPAGTMSYNIFRSTDYIIFTKMPAAATSDPKYTYKINDPQLFGMYTLSSNMLPLPVELAWFKAERHGHDVTLSWMTASEKDNSGFEVQRSGDGKSFSKIGFVESQAVTTSTAQFYTFRDNSPGSSGTRYYRLAQIDVDGTTTYSNIKAVGADEMATGVSAFPNPFTDKISLLLPAGPPRQVQVTIANSMGQVLQQQSVTMEGGQLLLPVALPAAKANGVYLLQVTDQQASHVFKLLKK